MIQAKSAIGQASVVDGVVISALWGDHTASFFVVERDEASRYIDLWNGTGAICAHYEEAETQILLAHGAWVGIRETAGGPVAGWGHAVLTIS